MGQEDQGSDNRRLRQQEDQTEPKRARARGGPPNVSSLRPPLVARQLSMCSVTSPLDTPLPSPVWFRPSGRPILGSWFPRRSTPEGSQGSPEVGSSPSALASSSSTTLHFVDEWAASPSSARRLAASRQPSMTSRRRDVFLIGANLFSRHGRRILACGCMTRRPARWTRTGMCWCRSSLRTGASWRRTPGR